MSLKISLRVRLILSIVSGTGCTLVWFLEPDFASLLENLWFYGLSGLFFAAGILFPYIRQDKFMHLRGAALIVASTLGYWGAMSMTIDYPFYSSAEWPAGSETGWFAYLAGSFTGAFTVMLAVALIAPVRVTLLYPVLGIVASVAGGLVTTITFNQDGFLVMGIGYVSWHMLVCLAIYYGTKSGSTDHQAIP